MKKQPQTSPALIDDWRVMGSRPCDDAIGRKVELLFRNWEWAVRESNAGEESKPKMLAGDSSSLFEVYRGMKFPDGQFSPELLFQIWFNPPVIVYVDGRDECRFSPKGWELIGVGTNRGRPRLDSPFSIEGVAEYLFSSGKQWLRIVDSTPRIGSCLSDDDAADWCKRNGWEVPGQLVGKGSVRDLVPSKKPEGSVEKQGCELLVKDAKGNSRKRSNESKEPILTATLLKHHAYENGSVSNWNPIGTNKLAELASVSNSTASGFFSKWFGSHRKYIDACRSGTVRVTLTQFAGEPVLKTYGSDPESYPNED